MDVIDLHDESFAENDDTVVIQVVDAVTSSFSERIQKKDRGFYDYRSDGTVLCLKWNDNNAVTFASNYYGIVPVHKKTFGKTIFPQPHLIKMYNLGMGGVDVCDRLLSAY